MAKFTTSQGKFVWTSGDASSEVEQHDITENNEPQELREKTDYFSTGCSGVFSNLESCFNQKVALFQTNLDTDYSDFYDTNYEIRYTDDNNTLYSNVATSKYTDAYDPHNGTNYVDVNGIDRSGDYYDHRGSWVSWTPSCTSKYSNEKKTVNDGQRISVNNSDADEVDTGTIETGICTSENINHNYTENSNDNKADRGSEYQGHYSDFDDQ